MRGRQGQIAVLFLVIAAVTVLLALFLINVGQVGITKTATAVAADTAALSVGSSVGSVSRQLALSLGDGKKYKSKKCQLNILTIVLIVVIVIIIIIISIICWGSCTAALLQGFSSLIGTSAVSFSTLAIVGTVSFYATTLAIVAIGAAISLGIREGILAPREARAFNRQFASFSNMKDPIRENAILVAFLRVIDDPNEVSDTTDIDQDGDAAERVSRFAQEYDMRLKGLIQQAVAQKAQALPEVTALRTKLATLQPALQDLSDELDTKIIPIFEWVESIPHPISFWMPGDQANLAGEPDEDHVPCEWDNNVDCGPGAAGVPDKVDWLKVQLATFLPFADMIIAMPDDVLLAASFQIQEIMQEYWLGELRDWRSMMQQWVNELTMLRSRIPWPPTFTISGANPLCSSVCSVAWPPAPPSLSCGVDPGTGLPVTGCSFIANPGTLPSAALLAAIPEALGVPPVHPLTIVINRLNAARDAINKFNPTFFKFTPKPVSTDNPIYSWEDNRGWHHVQVEVGKFEIPKMGIRRNFFRPCVLVRNASQKIKVAVTRYDQDNVVANGAYTLRYRQNASSAVGFDPGGDADHASNPGKYLAQGLRSESEVAHGYKPNSVGIVKTK